MITEDGALEVRRDGLLARVERARPRIIALVAPAGFGKSTLARQLASGDAVSVCDCAHVRDDLDLARLIDPAVAGDGSASVAKRVDAALDAWRAGGRGTTIFENAELADGNHAARAFLLQLIATLPDGRRAIVCSRSDLRVHQARRGAPHEVLVLRASDLAFDARELRMLAGEAESDAAIASIAARSRGWPAAVQLLLRSGGPAADVVRDYFADHVLATLDPPALDALVAAAAVPEARASEIATLFPGAPVAAALQRLVEESAMLYRDAEGKHTVHPLIAAEVLRGRDGARTELLRGLAIEREEAKAFERAAELQLALGNTDEAARVLARAPASLDRAPPPGYARVLAALDRSQIARYPSLWCVACLRRLYADDLNRLLDEAESTWRTLSPNADPEDRLRVFSLRALLQNAAGAIDDAAAGIEAYPRGSPLVAYLRALIAAHRGDLTEAERGFAGVLSAIASMDAAASGAYVSLGAGIARARGERALEVQFLDRAVDLARRSELTNVEAVALAETAFGAWFAGEDDAFARTARRLGFAVEAGAVRGLAYFAGVTGGAIMLPRAGDSPRYTALGAIVAAASVAGMGDAARHATVACDAARAYASPFVECIAEVARAQCDRSEFDAAMERALAAARRCDSRPLRDAVEAVAERRDGAGMLAPFVARFAAERRKRRAPLELGFAGGDVRVSGSSVHLSDREAELLFALGVRRDATPRIRLAAQLWPELDDDAGRNALSVCLHRVRSHLGKDAVKRDGDGYRLRDDASVDLWDVEETLASMRGEPSNEDRIALEACARQLALERPARMDAWEWFTPIARRIDAMRTDVAYRLGADALRRGDHESALARALEIVGFDPLDEAARELAIRAYLAIGDRAAATRQYRQYREMLLAELKCEPAPSLTRLLYA